ncbi:calcium-binding protein [Telluribacter sp.]|jgi:hypothetical protein|uniref:calcium-binding protein n=1 Tax=Telluribacter sp. TaxID=1978767 RepID=UPI002E1669E6|nr:calcium-binding protein [Telluribacter sp.]
MLTPDQIQQIIDDEIIVDAYDEYEISSGWYETMNDRLNFPFEATATLTKKGGGTEAKRVTVVGLSGEPAQFLDKDFHLQIELGDYRVTVKYTQLSDIDADEGTLDMFQIWNYWVSNE